MMSNEGPIKLGIVGSGGRGGRFCESCEALEELQVVAVCDIDEQRLEESRHKLQADLAYADYEQMLDESGIDAVLVGTPMPLHAPQAIAALQRGIHVISEVPAAVSIEQCKQLVAAVKRSDAHYMMAENLVYLRANQIVGQLVRQGRFGQIYYAEGEYLHELKQLNEVTKWRRKWQTGINGITYGTHSLGPILHWMKGDRVASVCCRGSGHHYRDPRNDEYENEDSCVMLAKMVTGGLVKIRVDMLSDRPHGSNNTYQLQGTDGCFESARATNEHDRIWLRDQSADDKQWIDLEELSADNLPPLWRQYEKHTAQIGHEGTDLLVLADIVNALAARPNEAIDIHAAMDMTLPGLISQQSIAREGQWLDVPDSRTW